jgi:long-subunit fatty acid transport protein
MKKLMMALAMVGLVAGPALANQCPTLIKQITDATAGKTDAASKKAVALANDAKALHEAGKHADSVKKAQEAAAAINLQLKMKE